MSGSTEVMAYARGQTYRAGENARGATRGALWLFTLPHPSRVRSIAWLGTPSPADMATIGELMADADIAVVPTVEAMGSGRYDLVVVTGANARRIGFDAAARERVLISVAASGSMVVEGRGHAVRRLADALESTADRSLAVLHLHPLRGPARAVMRADDPAAVGMLASRGLLRASVAQTHMTSLVRRGRDRATPSGEAFASSGTTGGPRLRLGRLALRAGVGVLARVERFAATRPMLARSLLVHGPQAGQLPAYLREAARSSSFDLEPDIGWTLARPGDFASQKLLWLLRPAGASDPTVVAKMTHDRRFSSRLANAHAALSSLNALNGVPQGAVPKALFAGEEAGLAIAAESAARGRPMAALDGLGPDAPSVRSVLEWLGHLGVATQSASSGSEVASALGVLLDALAERRALADAEVAVLRGQLDVVASFETVPVVFQHGDPGVLNIIARQDGSITMLDWENAEPRGMPLWDVLYFVRSLAVATGTRRRLDRLQASLRPFVEDGPLNALLAEFLADAARRVALPPEMIRPLLLHCWVQQALKETTRLPANEAARSIFLRFLRRLIAARETPPMRRLYGREPCP